MKLRNIDDVDESKKWIRSSVIDAFSDKEYKGRLVTLRIKNPKIDERDFSLADQKKALLYNRNLSEPVRADLELIENASGKVLEKKKNFLLANMPYHTGRNTIVSNGASYSTPAMQLRLRPGAYTRRKSNGEIETHFNLISGTGSGFRIGIDPKKGVFNVKLRTVNAPLYPLLKEMGVNDEDLKRTWGDKVYEANQKSNTNIVKFYEKLVPFGKTDITEEEKKKAIVDTFLKARMDKDVNRYTLGKPIENLNPEAMLISTKKILDVSKGQADEDDRDSLLYKKVFSAEDFYKEKILKDAGDLGKKIAHKLDRKLTLSSLMPGIFTKQLWGVVKSDPTVSPNGTLSQPIEEINPIDLYDQHHKITLMGEGGIGNIREVTMEARNVHPSEFGFIDNVRTPESFNVGIDKRLAFGTKKGDDNLLYKQFTNAKTGKKEFLNPMQASQSVIAFPGEWESKKSILDVMKKSKVAQVPRSEVEYYLPTAFEQYSTYDNMVPLSESIQGNRMILASKAIATSLPLKYGEAPLLQVLNPTTNVAFEKELADKVVNKLSKVDGVVAKVDEDNIYIKSGNKLIRHGLYNNFPLNLKTSLHHTVQVKVGDKVKKGSLLANSNYSDKDGILSSGKNLTSAYLPYKSWNFEDGIRISESAAKKLTSIQMYANEYDIDDEENQVVDKVKFVNAFPKLYDVNMLNDYDPNGVIKKGTKVKPGQPLILAMEKRPPSARDIQLGNLHKSLRNKYKDATVVWGHHSDGEVTDVAVSGKTVKVMVKTESAAQVGDKITGRFGNKGVISSIAPDNEMPRIKSTNEPVDILLNTVALPSRINPGQLHEALLQKIAKKTGKKYILPSFSGIDLTKFVEDEMKKNGVTDADDLIVDGKEVKDVLTGTSYIWKLSKLSEGEMKKRNIGGYDIDQQPIKGKGEQGQALRMGQMEVNALIAHGAKNLLREISTIKGQRNDEFWRQLKLGQPLPTPKVPFVYTKFMTMLNGAGINTKKVGNSVRLVPMTNKDIMAFSSGEIKEPDLLYTKNLQPIRNGLFDPGITGGLNGSKWSHIKLEEPLPNPVMEDVIKKILRMTAKEFKQELELGNIPNKIKSLNIDEEIKSSEVAIKTAKTSVRDNELKRLGFLNNLKKNNLTPNDLLLKYVPVLPPTFRPISVLGASGTIQPGNANLLYKDLMVANQSFAINKKDLPNEALKTEREILYKSLGAVSGLAEPINLQNKSKGVTGFIETIVGDQPKTGYFQKKVLSKTQDLVTRGVVSPNPTLDMDSIALPEDSAWHIYKPFIIRNMVRNGISAVKAEKEVEDRTERAKIMLEAEMKERPVALNRNPSLHKFNVMAFYPKLSKESTIQVSPQIVTGFNMDFDGDQGNIFVPVTPEAVNEAKEKLLPSKNLFHVKNRDVHYLPSHGTVMGLYSLTQQPDNKKVVKVYNNVKDLEKDYYDGKIKATDVVEVKEM